MNNEWGFIFFNCCLFLNQRISELKEYFSFEFFEQGIESILNDWDFCQLLNWWPLLRILGEQPIDDVFKLIWVELMRDRVMRITDDCRDSGPSLLTLKREPKGAQLIGDDSDRPHILLRDVWLGLSGIQNFRGQILDCAFDWAHGRGKAGIIWLHILGEPKVT